MKPARAVVSRWDALATDEPMPGVQRQRVIGAQAMISRVHLAAGVHVPTHSHANEQFGVVVSGRIRFGLGADSSPDRWEATLSAGEVIHLPANYPHSADALEDTLILDIFSPPSAGTGLDRK
ncbi:MAG: cupin domain-containing protein [Phycisphaerales bacterium]|nr:cupin domain-containing protein [Phycisphaerales bacterium]